MESIHSIRFLLFGRFKIAKALTEGVSIEAIVTRHPLPFGGSEIAKTARKCVAVKSICAHVHPLVNDVRRQALDEGGPAKKTWKNSGIPSWI